MALTSRWVDAPPEAVFAVLEDGWSYCAGVVGTAKIRSVDDTWPAAGSTIHHSVGAWPLLLDDTTTSVSYVPGQRWPLDGTARLTDQQSGADGSLDPHPARAARELAAQPTP